MKKAQKKMNKNINVVDFTPKALADLYHKAPSLRAQFHGVVEPDKFLFKFAIGDRVVLKAKAGVGGRTEGAFGVKRSLGDSIIYTIIIIIIIILTTLLITL